MKTKDLKNSILQMAVEGKLVPQDPSDEPASVLLERIREEKHELIAEGKAKFPKGGESIIYIASDGSPYEKRVDAKGRVLSDGCIAGEMPFEELPEGWAWARLEDCCNIIVDCPHSTPNYLAVETGYSAIDTNCMDDDWRLTGLRSLSQESYEKRTARYAPQVGDIVFSREGSIGRSVILREGNICLGQRVVLLSCNEALLFNRYCQAVLSSPYAWTLYRAANVGTGVKHINVSMIKTLLIPLPPLVEQRRIVERVNELMPLVEEYGKLEDAREDLDAALPGRLRKSVLQMAVQGKLVSQDPGDEPASVLLERIREQRCQLAAEKKMKATKGGESVIFTGSDGRRYEKRVDAKGRESEPVCIEDEIPFEIPEGWGWARLESVTTYIQRGKSPRYSTVKKHPVVAQKCNQWSGFSLEKAKFIDPETVCKYGSERILRDGDLLWNSTGLGTLGRMAIYDSSENEYGWAVADSHVTVIRTREDWLNYRFAFAYFAGPSVQSVIEDRASGSTKQKELAQETVKNYLIPIPPLAEQCRIVTQLEAVLSQVTNQ